MFKLSKAMKRKLVFTLILLILILGTVSYISSQDISFNVCCEKTKSGAWCQNTKEIDCDDRFRKSPTSCDATSFCKLGCCVDSEEGLCMKNTPQRVCEISSGTWLDDESCNVPQCGLGCCILGDQASFVTLTRCKRISRIYGLETNFKRDITNEVDCILTAHAADKGACVYESDEERTCRFSTRQECLNSQKQGNISGEVEFFKDLLCTADELATNCGPTRETICIDGKDEVYFKDTCGNPANIYDANRIYSKDRSYWHRVVHKTRSCGSNTANTNSKGCGNCNYLKGSICGKGRATFGDNLCRDLNCYNTQNGQSYKNGESWCQSISEGGQGNDAVGNRYFRHVCVQGEEIIEPCADFRNEICIEREHEAAKFTEAACRVNRWSDCIDQFTERDCQNTDRRDCLWVAGLHYDGSGSKEDVKNLVDSDYGNKSRGILKGGNICLPRFPPGLEFWKEGNAKSVCGLGNSKQMVKFEEDILKNKKCVDNCEVLERPWVETMNRACTTLGDCGAKANIAGQFTDFGIVWKQNGKRKDLQSGLLEDVKESAAETERQEVIENAGKEKGGDDGKVFNK